MLDTSGSCASSSRRDSRNAEADASAVNALDENELAVVAIPEMLRRTNP